MIARWKDIRHDKCQIGSREAISKRIETEPKTGASVRIKCTSQYG